MFRKKHFIILSVLIISILALVGCSNNSKEANSDDQDSQSAEEEIIAIEHPLGKAEVKKNPERVIVFDYATLDSLDKMGVEILGLNEFGFAPADSNIEVSKHGQSITFEYILEKNPDYVFVIDRAAVAGGNVTAEQIFDNDLIKETDAYKNGRIVYLTSQIWYVASGGLQGTNIMIEDIQQALSK